LSRATGKSTEKIADHGKCMSCFLYNSTVGVVIPELGGGTIGERRTVAKKSTILIIFNCNIF
jgi:hypothetical protein